MSVLNEHTVEYNKITCIAFHLKTNNLFVWKLTGSGASTELTSTNAARNPAEAREFNSICLEVQNIQTTEVRYKTKANRSCVSNSVVNRRMENRFKPT